MIKEHDKVKLMTGEIARISEVLKAEVAFVAEVYKEDGGVSVEPINIEDIKSVFTETETLIAHAG